MWKIALVDDDRRVVQSMKKSIPWDTLDAVCSIEAMDGLQGLDGISQNSVDIVITDVYMPVMNGLDMIDRLRKQGYNGIIIILSGYSDFEYARQALRLRVDDYLSKPVTLQTIVQVLEKAISKLEDQSIQQFQVDHLRRQLLEYEPFLEREGLKSLLTGSYGNLDIEWYIEKHPELIHWRFLVFAVEIVRTVRISDISVSDWNLFRFAVNNVIKEVLSTAWAKSTLVELQGSHEAILLMIPKEDADEQALQERIRLLGIQIIKNVERYLSIRLRIGIGLAKHEWKQIHDSTEEAFQALTAKKGSSSSTVELYMFGLSENQLTIRRTKPIKLFKELAEALKLRQVDRAIFLIEEYVATLVKADDIQPVILQQLVVELWTMIRYALYDVGLILEEIVSQDDLSVQWNAIIKPEQLQEWLIERVKEICGHPGWNGNIKHKQAVDFMISYVHENFAKEITLSDLARQLYISRNYLSHIFREATGETFNNYLTKVRMERARGLVLEGKYLIYEIAEMVGYKNIPYFSTLFKKVIGVNPSELANKTL